MRYELTSIPSHDADKIQAFKAGVEAGINHASPPGSNPMGVELEFRKSGNCHIYAVYGQWLENGEIKWD